MSVLLTTEDGWVISHSRYLKKIYKKVTNSDEISRLEFDEKFFFINSQFLRDDQFRKSENGISDKRKSKKRQRSQELSQKNLEQLNNLKEAFCRVRSCAAAQRLFEISDCCDNNKEARAVADNFYSESSLRRLGNFHGFNNTEDRVVAEIGKEKYVFPEKCIFYANDVRDISQKLDSMQRYDLILMDPPWWNKFVRRKKEKVSESGYDMMYNEDFAKIPIPDLLESSGIVAVWCTNAQSHSQSIINEMFPAWGVTYVGKWHWVKVTQSGKPICDFNTTEGKQPYESLIFGEKSLKEKPSIPDKKLIVSVPSCVHSHKPPIVEVIRPYLKKDAKCLELFARYLLPGWTSWGLEVLKFQHLSLYKIFREPEDDGSLKNAEK